jgi:XTP/dITP diphosphohydrolase
MKLIFATHNQNKFTEIKSQLPANIEILSLQDVAFSQEIPEPYLTLEENAATKANTIFNFFKEACFSDDTGLFVPALNGAPGVHSARYSGPEATPNGNMVKLLKALENTKDRKAYFQTTIALKTVSEIKYFTGKVHGSIALSKKGIGGFGYDPIFIPENYSESFAELPLEIKQKIGHRGKAISALIAYLKDLSF